MENYEALAVVEIRYFTYALEALDHMTKTSGVEFISSENDLGGRLVTVIAGGSVSDVFQAVEAVKQLCSEKEKNPLKMALTITNPHPEIMKFIIPRKISQRKEDGTEKPLNGQKNMASTQTKAKRKEKAVKSNEKKRKTTKQKTTSKS